MKQIFIIMVVALAMLSFSQVSESKVKKTNTL